MQRNLAHVYPAVRTINKDIALVAFIHCRCGISEDNLAAFSFFCDYFLFSQFYLPF